MTISSGNNMTEGADQLLSAQTSEQGFLRYYEIDIDILLLGNAP